MIYALPMCIQISKKNSESKGTRCLPQSTPQTPPKRIPLRFRMIFWNKKSPGYMEANTLDVELARVLCLTHIRAPRSVWGTGGGGRKLQYSKTKKKTEFSF